MNGGLINNIFFVDNLEEMRLFSKKLLNLLHADSFLLLSGDVGVGKTTLVQFISSNFGIKDVVNSPTFGIFKRYWIEDKKFFLNHFDFFRLGNNEDVSFLNEFKIGNVNIIE
jgi:tRNA threonylcarbamoyl adenosine modification protein YjeE